MDKLRERIVDGALYRSILNICKCPRYYSPVQISTRNVILNCAVLEDGTRVLTQERFRQAIGRSWKPTAGRGSSTQVEKVAPFLNAKNLSPFIDK